MAKFSEALEQNPAPTALGDIALRFEPSMLIGETGKAVTVRPTAAWLAGVVFLLVALGALVLSADSIVISVFLLLATGAMAAASRLDRLEKSQRRFVANFGTNTLRLDFSTPIAGQPRTLLIPFDDVADVQVMTQADGRLCLVVDFKRRGRVLREVLAAFVPLSARDEAERLQRTLHNAFGLGEAPADSPAFANDESTFEG